MSRTSHLGARQADAEFSWPALSVVIPCRNEEKTIRQCLTTLLEGDYPLDALQLMVIDGGSSDGTRGEVETIIEANPDAEIEIIDNPAHTPAAAMNLGLGAATGEVVALAGAHASYPSDYFTSTVRGLIETGADCVGGTIGVVPGGSGPVAHAIALALAHPFGVGNSLMRLSEPATPTESDVVAFGCWWRSTLIELGGFDERMKRSADFAIGDRLRRKGGRMMLLPGVRVDYVARATLTEVARHNFSNGYWVGYPAITSSVRFAPRHFAPLAFVSGSLLSLLPARRVRRLGWAVGLSYLMALLVALGDIRRRVGESDQVWVVGCVFPVIHVSYGLGSLVGMFAALKNRLLGP